MSLTPRTRTTAKHFLGCSIALFHPFNSSHKTIRFAQSIKNRACKRGHGSRGTKTSSPYVVHAGQPENDLRCFTRNYPQSSRARNKQDFNTTTLTKHLKRKRVLLATTTLPTATTPPNQRDV